MKGMQKIRRGKGFGGAVRYCLLRKKSQPPGELIGGNMAGITAEELTREFGEVRRLRPDIEKPVWHNSLRLPADEVISRGKLVKVADDYMHRMGFNPTHQRIYVLHADENCVHIVANRVSAEGEIYLGRNENLKSTRHIQALEKEHGLQITKGPEIDLATGKIKMPAEASLKKGEIEKAVETGEEPIRQQLQRLIDEATVGFPSATEFAERLEAAGVTVRANVASTGKMNGFSFALGEVAFKASQLGAHYKWGKLQERVRYEQDRDHKGLERFRTPASDRADGPPTEREYRDLAPAHRGVLEQVESTRTDPQQLEATGPIKHEPGRGQAELDGGHQDSARDQQDKRKNLQIRKGGIGNEQSPQAPPPAPPTTTSRQPTRPTSRPLNPQPQGDPDMMNLSPAEQQEFLRVRRQLAVQQNAEAEARQRQLSEEQQQRFLELEAIAEEAERTRKYQRFLDHYFAWGCMDELRQQKQTVETVDWKKTEGKVAANLLASGANVTDVATLVFDLGLSVATENPIPANALEHLKNLAISIPDLADAMRTAERREKDEERQRHQQSTFEDVPHKQSIPLPNV